MKKLTLAITICLASFLFVSGCYGPPVRWRPVRIDGPYKGRVIDADTRRPIEGVVVLGVWYKEYPIGATGGSEFYDAEETLTDKNGDFEIKGQGLLVLSFIDEMDVLIFKSGYEYIGFGPWVSLKGLGFKGYQESYDPVTKMEGTKPIFDSKKKLHWEGDRAIIPLRKLTMEERWKQGTPSYPGQVPDKKVKLMLKETNREEKALKPRIIQQPTGPANPGR